MRAAGVGYRCWFLWRRGVLVRACVAVVDGGLPDESDASNGGEPPNDPADPALSMRVTGLSYRPWRCKWRCRAGACGVGVDIDNDGDDVEGRRGLKWRGSRG
ncbi:hypothetical protein C8J57DRAFT_1500873 [Mycena rebaudengoi]|nr:hypothetical protein C8J57DRAFT_1500873 [Mycena rebaudengoi]